MVVADRSVAVPTRMRAAVIREHGGSDKLRVEDDVPTPQPGPGELLLASAAVGLNHLDVFAREGLKGPGVPPIRLPHVSGVDVAGVVAAHGPGVSAPPIGTRVVLNPSYGCGTCRQCRRGEHSMCPNYAIVGEHRWGGLAEYVAVPARSVIPLPDHVPFTRAAAVPAAYTTAWRGVINAGRLQAGERLLVVGASGGVGVAALQIGVMAGATVFAVAGTEAKRQRARELGASAVFDSREDWIPALRELTDGEGVDMVHDAVGAPTWRRSIQSLAMGGRLVVCGATAGDRPEISIRELYQSHRQIIGAPMGNWQDFLDTMRVVFDGKLVPEVHRVYPFEQLAEAEDALDRREHFGKIVVQVADL
jgi:NADPH:quinone reductase-like Zn-dependent oxidoreductase